MLKLGNSGVGSSYDGQGKWDISKGIERMHYRAFTALVPDHLIPNKAVLEGKLPDVLHSGRSIRRVEYLSTKQEHAQGSCSRMSDVEQPSCLSS